MINKILKKKPIKLTKKNQRNFKNTAKMIYTALAIYCCITNNSQTNQFAEAIITDYLTVLVGQEFGNGSPGCFWLRVSLSR